jgi:hypothetical protein
VAVALAENGSGAGVPPTDRPRAHRQIRSIMVPNVQSVNTGTGDGKGSAWTTAESEAKT